MRASYVRAWANSLALEGQASVTDRKSTRFVIHPDFQCTKLAFWVAAIWSAAAEPSGDGAWLRAQSQGPQPDGSAFPSNPRQSKAASRFACRRAPNGGGKLPQKFLSANPSLIVCLKKRDLGVPVFVSLSRVRVRGPKRGPDLGWPASVEELSPNNGDCTAPGHAS